MTRGEEGVIALCRREPRRTLRRRGFCPCQSRRPHYALADLPPLGSRTGEAREEVVVEPAVAATVTAPSPEMNPTGERGNHLRRRRSSLFSQKLPPSNQLLQWLSPVVNGCGRSSCGRRNHTEVSAHFCRRRTSLPSPENSSVIVIGIRRRCCLRWLSDCRQAGSVIAAVPVQPFLLRSCCDGYCESGWELRFWLPSVRAEVERIM
ncbi:uncharacterized protein LOC130932616 [Arachis stenosperma]|uniref:uncharacterized protein LOC130932616 n=1 Tax=Arachis stenosperma TaxID=217475 RepID=UPI0025AC275A|nr:uncharacterized protein LOC130932616 [Arachis stenosperma]